MQAYQKILARRRQFKVVAEAPRANQIGQQIGLDPNFPDQNNFILDTSTFIDAQCSRRAGKSSGLGIRFSNTMAKYPGSTCIYCALTGDSARDIMWPVLEELCEKYKLPYKLIPSRLTVVHPNGSKLKLYGADMKNFIRRLKGRKSPGIGVDEAQDFGTHLKSLVDDVLTPMIADYPDGWLAITGTPGAVPNGYFFEITQERKYGFSHHEWDLTKNPYMPDPEGFIQRLIEKKKWETNNPTLLREWRNKWVLDVESLWIKYKTNINDFVGLPDRIQRWNYILGIDIGFRDADAFAVLAWSESCPETYLIDEIITNKQDITGLRLQIQALRDKYSFHKMVIDTGGLGKKIAEELTNRYGLQLSPADKLRKQENVGFLNDALRMGVFRARADSRFAKDSYMIQVDWDKSTPDRIVVKKNPHSDIIDAVLYAFKESPAYAYAPPETKPLPGTPEYDKMQEDKHLQAAIDKVKQEKDLRDGKGSFGNWSKDKKGIPDWNKW